MWVIQKPKKVALWNKRHFEEKNGECSMFKILSTYICWKKYIKCNIWRVAVRPSYIQDARFLKVKTIKRVSIFHTTVILNSSRYKNNRARHDTDVYWSSCKVSVILGRFSWNLSFHNIFSKYTDIPNFMEIRPVGAELFHADGQTWKN